MHLTTFTDYALRVLISVGTKGDHELSTVSEMSKQYSISKNHLIKVVHHLSKTGYLETSQGKGGGLRLAKHPSNIRIGDVIRDTENHFDLVPCFSPAKKGGCAIEQACVLKRALREAVNAFLAVTDDYTLADLLRPRHRLKTLLAVNA